MINKMYIYKYNLINNIKQVKLNNPNSLVCAMVKANAYGVGQTKVVKILNDYVDYFGVACFFEAKKIKKLTNKKILIVGALERTRLDRTFSYTCNSIEDVKYLIKKHERYNIHLKVNSGMNRFGFKNVKEFEQAVKLVKNSKLNIEGVFTHFATSDDYVDVQFKKFKEFLSVLKRYNIKTLIHADNSIVQEANNHNLDMVRVGFNLYNINNNKFLPAVEIVSKIVQINSVKKGELIGYDYRCVAKTNMRVAVVPVGYADGFDLKYIGLKLYIGKHLCKVLNVCMDCFIVDITNTDIKKGDNVYILNKQNSLKIYSTYSNILEYQVMTNLSNIRAKRLISVSKCKNKQN